MNDLPSKLRELAESLRSCEWNHPLTAADTCEEAAKLLEVFIAVPDSCRDYEEVIRQLSGLPSTWYPAILMHAVEEAYKANVFLPGGASSLVAKVECKNHKSTDSDKAFRLAIDRAIGDLDCLIGRSPNEEGAEAMLEDAKDARLRLLQARERLTTPKLLAAAKLARLAMATKYNARECAALDEAIAEAEAKQ